VSLGNFFNLFSTLIDLLFQFSQATKIEIRFKKQKHS